MKNLFLSSIVLISLVCLSGCGAKSDATKTSANTDNVQQKDASKIFVTLLEVELRDPSDSIRLVGASSSPNLIELSTDMAGLIKSIPVDEGKEVIEGDVIAYLDNTLILAELNTLETQLSLARVAFEKQKRLYKQNVSTEIQYLEAKNNKEVLESSIASLETRLGKNKVIAPISGMVDKVYATVGNVASPGFPIARIVNFDTMEVTMDIPETYINEVGVGDNMTVVFPALNLRREAKVHYISQVINSINRTITILLRVDNEDNLLKHNMLAEVYMDQYTGGPSIFIPEQLIQYQGDQPFVYTTTPIAGDTTGSYEVKKQEITIDGSSIGGLRKVRQGISVGDFVVNENYRGVDEGDRVYISHHH